ncbi:MAG: Polynucleotide 5'-hydroxyl-kinase grc3 [Phylliscum demangeonii]|nr:MAG: Polynucleotide 5'-hydroxyl-kinase grc3 [Phylliscum demangeonii]
MALVRGINRKDHTLQLVTPIPSQTIRRLTKAKAGIVLVSGKLESPHWAYVEDLVCEANHAKKRPGDDGRTRMLEWGRAGKIPWVAVVKEEAGEDGSGKLDLLEVVMQPPHQVCDIVYSYIRPAKPHQEQIDQQLQS